MLPAMATATPREGLAPAPNLHPSHQAAGWHPDAACQRLLTLAERLGRTIAVARGLIAAARTVDLAGLEDGVGLLCAKALDLEREDARRLLPALLELRAQIDGLSVTITCQHSQPVAPAATRRGAH